MAQETRVIPVHDPDLFKYPFLYTSEPGQMVLTSKDAEIMREYLQRGRKGLVSYVESNNFGSLKSCYRMGYADFGNIYAARCFNRYLLHSDAGCRPYGFRLESVRSHGNKKQ